MSLGAPTVKDDPTAAAADLFPKAVKNIVRKGFVGICAEDRTCFVL
jgi:hypothetical protein